ncbi:uncharacterized protein METZ01_LOCUS77121, partial [marine metagenome]
MPVQFSYNLYQLYLKYVAYPLGLRHSFPLLLGFLHLVQSYH